MREPSWESDEEKQEEKTPPPPRPPLIWGKKRVLTKHLSMRETKRELKWEKRRRQMYLRSLSGKSDWASTEEEEEEEGEAKGSVRRRSLTDEDLDELRGSIDLGFGFDEENGGRHLCGTLPALHLYFAVNRHLSDPNIMHPSTPTPSSYGTPSPRSPFEQGSPITNSSPGDGWKIFNPGDSPQHVKTRLKHWAQVVACSVRQCC